MSSPGRRALGLAGRAALSLGLLCAGGWLVAQLGFLYESWQGRTAPVTGAHSPDPAASSEPEEGAPEPTELDAAQARIRQLEQEREDLRARAARAELQKTPGTPAAPSAAEPSGKLADDILAAVERAGRERESAPSPAPAATPAPALPSARATPPRQPRPVPAASVTPEPAVTRTGASSSARAREEAEPRPRLLPTERLPGGGFR